MVIIEHIKADLAGFRGEGEGGPPIPDELVAYSLLGALEISGMRASWDDTYSRRDVMWTHLHIYLALKALLSGPLDLSEQTERYAEIVERLAELLPPVPPAVFPGEGGGNGGSAPRAAAEPARGTEGAPDG